MLIVVVRYDIDLVNINQHIVSKILRLIAQGLAQPRSLEERGRIDDLSHMDETRVPLSTVIY